MLGKYGQLRIVIGYKIVAGVGAATVTSVMEEVMKMLNLRHKSYNK